jgi:hypothetical protein
MIMTQYLLKLKLMNDSKFYKLLIIENFLVESEKVRKQLSIELVNNAVNDIKFMRRTRMLQQWSKFESQIIKKIYNFETDDIDDYQIGYDKILSEIISVSSRNA